MKIGIDIGGSHIGIGLVDEFGNIQQKKEKYIVEKIENESQINKQNLKEEITQFIIQTIKEYQKMDFVENSSTRNSKSNNNYKSSEFRNRKL